MADLKVNIHIIYMQTSQVYKMLTNDVTKHLLWASVEPPVEQVECRCETDKEVKLAKAPTLSVTLLCTFTKWILPFPKTPFETRSALDQRWQSEIMGATGKLLSTACMKQESKQ